MHPAYRVDSNIILDIVKDDPTWISRSARALAEASLRGGVAINSIILAEISVGFSDHDVFEQAMSPDRFLRLALPWEAAWIAVIIAAGVGPGLLRYRISTSAPMPKFLD